MDLKKYMKPIPLADARHYNYLPTDNVEIWNIESVKHTSCWHEKDDFTVIMLQGVAFPPIDIDKEGTVWNGNNRLSAARKCEFTHAPVVVSEN